MASSNNMDTAVSQQQNTQGCQNNAEACNCNPTQQMESQQLISFGSFPPAEPVYEATPIVSQEASVDAEGSPSHPSTLMPSNPTHNPNPVLIQQSSIGYGIPVYGGMGTFGPQVNQSWMGPASYCMQPMVPQANNSYPLVMEPSSQSLVSSQTSGLEYEGTVKWFNAAKGYGFITPDAGYDDLFVHQTDIVSKGYRSLKQGGRVQYSIIGTGDGRNKANMVLALGEKDSKEARNSQPQSRSSYEGIYHPPFTYGYNQLAYLGQGKQGTAVQAYPMPYYTFAPVQTQIERTSAGIQIVVHNLAWNCTWQELKDAFAEWNPVRADVAFDTNGRSRGFGVVRFNNQEDTQAAINSMNNALVAGRPVTVRLDKFA